MIITEKQFYLEELDYTIPELAQVRELYLSCDTKGAEAAFANFFRSSLDVERYFAASGRTKEKDEKKHAGRIDYADRICRGIVTSCNFEYDYGGEIDWNFNGTPDGYREWLWQLNRHHVFGTLAYAYIETGDEKYADAFNRHITGWLRQAECPQWPVPNRSSAVPTWRTIDSGIRMLSNWPYSIHAFLHSPSIPDSTWVGICMSLWEHGQLLMHSPSSLNWLDIEMSGLNAIGTIYRVFRLSNTWREFAVNRMNYELKTQVYEDGFQCELSSGYQSVVISTNMGIYRLAKQYDMPIPDDFRDNVRKLYTIYPKLMRPDGRTPSTNDGANAVALDFMRAALVNFPDDPEFTKILEGRVDEVYPRDVVMPYAGIITMRTGWGADDVWLFFESGPLGAGHGHEDKLNVNLFAYGKNLLDPIGKYAYDGSKMRTLCLNSRGYNTGIVDGKGQRSRANIQPWTPDKVKIKSDLEVNIREDTVVAYGKYNRGYGGNLIDVTHERRVVFFRHGLDGSRPFFVLLDSFTAGDDAEHKYELSFPLYDVPLTLRGRRATLKAGDGVTLEIATHATLATTTAAYYPEYMGFRPSPDRLAEEHIPAPVVSIYDYGRVKHFATILYPTPDGAAPEMAVRCDAESFTITFDGVEHTFSRDEDFLKTEGV